MFGKTNPHSDSRTNNCIIHSYASLMDTAIMFSGSQEEYQNVKS
jgi:hypothetical protein